MVVPSHIHVSAQLEAQLSPILKRHALLTRKEPVSAEKEDVPKYLHALHAQASGLLFTQMAYLKTSCIEGEAYLKLRHIPYRKHISYQSLRNSRMAAKESENGCALCKDPEPLIFFNFKNLRIASNKFRYGENSLLIMSKEHKHQSIAAKLLLEVFRFMAAAGEDYTFFCNGLSGNSEHHAHFQALKERLPIRRAIENKDILFKEAFYKKGVFSAVLDKTKEDSASGKRVSHFYGAYFAGPLLEVEKSVGRFLEKLEGANKSRAGLFNLIFWQECGSTHVVVVPKKKVFADDKAKRYGALAHSGLCHEAWNDSITTYEGLKKDLLESVSKEAFSKPLF